MEPMTVVFCSDDNHALLLGVALCSIFENKKGNYPIQAFVLDGGISDDNRRRLAALGEQYRSPITRIVPDKQLFEKIPDTIHPRAQYYRMAMGRFLPHACRRVIYLDCDVIVRGDIAELFNLDLNGKTVGAVPDIPQDVRNERLEMLCGRKLPREATYFNSGILVIDMERWRALGTEEKLFAFAYQNPAKLQFADQDPLNVIFWNDHQDVSPRYNFVPNPANTFPDDDPLIVHFSAGDKPWYLLSALRYQPDYVRYANLSPWKNRKYKKIVDIYFAKKYHFYPLAWWLWCGYKKIRESVRGLRGG